ncbi:hypothetical protein, partial [Ralstonia sp. TCR112]|uniref:hypothetical protein n=1 Tax=Ralstonia sp. TCR112 TaxID=2601730 RepID=UPI001C9B10BB
RHLGRAFSFAYFSLARQRKVSRSRQGTKGGWTTNKKNPSKNQKHKEKTPLREIPSERRSFIHETS